MNTCIVLGAGATLANALHFHGKRFRKQRPPLDTTFFETVDALGITPSKPIRRYLKDFVGIDSVPTTLREFRMEEIFKDVSYDLRETPESAIALNSYIDLVDLYLRVLRSTTNWLCAPKRRGAPMGRLLDLAAAQSENLTIVTFNHDLVIENEIERRARLRKRWCLSQGYGSISSEFNLLFPTNDDSQFRLHHDDECDHEKPITILKLHGSLNWAVRIASARPTSNLLKTGGGNRKLHLVTRSQIVDRETYVRNSESSGRSRWTLWPIVVPPVYAKQTMRAKALEQTWADARKAIQSANRIVFYGYSLPELDVEAEKLVERGLLRNSTLEWMDVINPAASSAGRFADVSPALPVRWYPTLAEFFAADGFRQPI
jgi:hypothetical protein